MHEIQQIPVRCDLIPLRLSLHLSPLLQDINLSVNNNNNDNNNNIYLLQLGCHPVAVVILHVNKT